MSAEETARAARLRRHRRVRRQVVGSGERPRLCVFRSLKHIYAQIIDDSLGHTLAAASDLEEPIRSQADAVAKAEVSALVGGLVAQRALAKGVKKVVFDRGGFKYHGRVKSLAEAARSAGLEF